MGGCRGVARCPARQFRAVAAGGCAGPRCRGGPAQSLDGRSLPRAEGAGPALGTPVKKRLSALALAPAPILVGATVLLNKIGGGSPEKARPPAFTLLAGQ